MSDTQRQVRHEQKVAELCAGAVRAVSGERDLHFRGSRLHRGGEALPWFAPHLHPQPEVDDFASFRGAADGLALRVKLSDLPLHQSLQPADPVERLLFNLLEQFRIEALAPRALPGLKRNLRHRFERWSLEFHDGGTTETVRGMLLYATAQMCRSRLTGEPVVEATEDAIESARAKLAPLLGHALAGIRKHRFDQRDFAPHALEIAAIVAGMLEKGDEDAVNPVEKDKERAQRSVLNLVADMEAEVEASFSLAASGRSVALDEAGGEYRVFTTEYDEERRADELMRKALLLSYREQLDRRVAAQGINVARLARELRALLAIPERQGWDGGQEEGYIDGRALAQLIASPTERRLFRVERHEPQADCAVTFLIDCSGSMKEHIESIAMLVDVMARALEQAGATSEILGYTTGAWNGGRAMRDWQRAGKPHHPGRLNERCHLVFKDAAATWRKARPAIAGLLKADLFREGLDGEAVDWACQRLMARSESRKLLLVISDGSPMDSATHLANDAHYLDHHLRDVVTRHEQLGQVQIAGVGVGLDLSPYYRHSHVLDLAASTGNSLFRELIDLMAGRHQR